MEKIALISDIHSNIVALNAVLDDIEERNITKIYCLGDLVLKGSSPCEVVDLIREKCEIVIKGNCDDYVVNYPNYHTVWYKELLNHERIEYLDNLPMYKDLYISGSHVRLFHATKDDLNIRIFDNSTIEEKLKLFEDKNNNIPDIVIYADIHKQYLEKIRNKTIINIGSVGNSLEISHEVDENEDMSEITQAHYCVIEGELNCKTKKSLSIQFVRVPYDINKELEEAKKNDSPDYEIYERELLHAKYRGKEQSN
ncbi:MAG: metallophosphoesterase family protein [Bacilli bacterium]|nr:metallophosphoesterase family protein [Bacilli bacterium]